MVGAQIEWSHGIACCEVEGHDCISISTDEDLVRRYLVQHPIPGNVTPVRLDSPDVLATVIEEVSTLTSVSFERLSF